MIMKNKFSINHPIMYKWLKPKVDFVRKIRYMIRQSVYGKRIIMKYSQNNDAEIDKIIKFISKHGIMLYNYDWYIKYMEMEPQLFYDKEIGYYYFIHNNQKVYYKGTNINNIIADYRIMLSEMDSNCPHCYNNFIFRAHYDLIIDAGVAEGMFSLEHMHNAGRVVLVESDKEWCEVLKKTFYRYMQKVDIINKSLSNLNDANNVSLEKILDKYCRFTNEHILIKMDIEGYEENALLALTDCLNKYKNIELIVCTYHYYLAEKNIKMMLDDMGFKTILSKGYIFLGPDYEKKICNKRWKVKPSLRHALLYATK